MLNSSRQQVVTLGNQALLDDQTPVLYPRTEAQLKAMSEEELFRWFVNNDRSAARQRLEDVFPDDLPTLDTN